jgi:thiol:disulfide interchange protein DsbC
MRAASLFKWESVGLALLLAAPLHAAPVAEAVYTALGQELRDLALPGLDVRTLTFSPAREDADFIETVAGTYLFQISADGSFMLRNHYLTAREVDENQTTLARQQALAALAEDALIMFAPTATPRYVVTVFTDAACPFSAKFHQEIPALTAAGVKVRYVLYARDGSDSPDYLLNSAVWCSNTRGEALTQALDGGYPVADDCDTPLAAFLELGESFGVVGTPTLVFEDGSQYTGYYPSNAILDYLNGVAPLRVPLP